MYDYFIINGGVTFEKFLITVVIILLIGALGFAIYAAINHSTSSNHNNEQDNKATHQKKDTEVNHQKTRIQTTQMKIKTTTTVLLMAINHLRHQLSKITVQQHQRIHNHLIRINQIQINQIQIRAVAVNLQRITKIINNRIHRPQTNLIMLIQTSLLSRHHHHNRNHLKLIIYLIRPQVSGT